MPKTPKPASSFPAGDDRNLVTVDENYFAPSFEDRLRLFWEKNSRTVLTICVLVVAVILGKGAYEVVSAQRERAVAADYAAATTDDQLKSFAAAHSGHTLGGLAQLRLADQAYAAGKYSDAKGLYDQAAGILKNNTFGQRARLGSAFSAVQTASSNEGRESLKNIVADSSLDKIVRSEAAYHLAALAAQSGDAAEAIRLIEQATVIDPDGQWADRASMLRTTLPVVATSANADDKRSDPAPAVSFK